MIIIILWIIVCTLIFIRFVYLLLYKERCCVWIQLCFEVMQLWNVSFNLRFVVIGASCTIAFTDREWLFIGESCSTLNNGVSVFLFKFENDCVMFFFSERGFLHLMLPRLLSFKARTVKPVHPTGHYTVSGTVVFGAILVSGSQGISVSVVTSPWVGWLRSKLWFLGGVRSCTVLQFVHTGSGGPLILLFCGFQCLFPSGKASGVRNWPLAFCADSNACYSATLYSKYFVAVRLSNLVPVAAAPLTLFRLGK
jgi:hypothetical protein